MFQIIAYTGPQITPFGAINFKNLIPIPAITFPPVNFVQVVPINNISQISSGEAIHPINNNLNNFTNNNYERLFTPKPYSQISYSRTSSRNEISNKIVLPIDNNPFNKNFSSIKPNKNLNKISLTTQKVKTIPTIESLQESWQG